MAGERKHLDVSNSSVEQKKEILKYGSEVRKFEIERFWQRSLFFWGFIGAAFVAYSQVAERPGNLSFFISCFGIVCSVAWTLQNRGSKYWQEAWEAKVESVERAVLGTDLFANREPIQRKGPWGAQTFSVSKLAIALSDFTVVVWIALAIKAFPPKSQSTQTFWESCAATIVTTLYVGLLFTCRQSERKAGSRSK